jgi:DNA-binding SARP family transcriptional activator
MTGEHPQDWRPSSPTADIALHVLGRFDLIVNGVSLELPVQVQKVLAFLALHAGSQPRDRVAEQVWPDADLRRCRGSLRTALWRVRRLGPDVVSALRGSIALGPGVRVDLEEGWTVLKDILDGRPVDDAWALVEQERVQQMYVHGLETLSRRLTADGQYAYALQAARAACRLEPLRESARRAVIEVHLAEGNRAQARRVYQDFRRLLREELGIEPSVHVMSARPAPPRAGRRLCIGTRVRPRLRT